MPSTSIVQEMNSLINGSATGAEVAMNGFAFAGIVIPASMAGTSMTFEVSLNNGVTWLPLRDDLGVPLTVSITANAAFYSLRRILPLGLGLLRPVSSASETNKTVTIVGQRIV